MNIAVIDVAASEGGALSVLLDFCETLRKQKKENHWYIITSVVTIEESEYVHNIKFPEVKKSWLDRIRWERCVFPKLMKDLKINIVFSLQNNAFISGRYTQIVYFHNVLLVQKFGSFLGVRTHSKELAVRTNLLGPYTRHTWRNADKIIVQGFFVKELLKRYYEESNIIVVKPEVTCPKECIGAGTKIKGYIYPTSGYEYKNIEEIIYAEKILNMQGKKIEILITIDGTENEYTKRMVTLAKETSGIRFIGFQDRKNIFDFYRNYGLIMTSKIESFGVPIVEAMMVGTVVVGESRPYIKELVSGYNRAYLVTPKRDLSNAILDGLYDEQKGNYRLNSEKKNEWNTVIDIILQSTEGRTL